MIGLIIMPTILLLILSFFSCTLLFSQQSKFNREDLEKLPSAPDYTQFFFWAAHPDKLDAADLVPGNIGLQNLQQTAEVDVFFVHPTIYTDDQNPENPWNADLADTLLNQKVDQSTIKNQASVFNGIARIYAPRYRQAHLEIFFTGDSVIKSTALDYAYRDVRKAFEYYLQNWNQNRPIIIASHSQGTLHATRLMQEFFDGTPLSERLVAAYLVGMPLKTSTFETIPPCTFEADTQCWMSWNTFKKGYYPARFAVTYEDALSTNPLNWRIDDVYASRDENVGGVLRKFDKIHPEVTDAQNHKGVLWSEKPYFPGRIFITTKRYHIADYNLFYLNIRENVKSRAMAYLKSTSN